MGVNTVATLATDVLGECEREDMNESEREPT